MKNTIKDLYWGNVAPWEDKPYEIEEMKELSRLMEENKKRLCDNLSSEEIQIIEKIESCQSELTYLVSEEAFARGFTLGVKLTAEAFANEK